MTGQAHMTSLFENATEGILLTNSKGEIMLANPAAYRMFDYLPGELHGNNIEILIPEDIRQRHVGYRDGFYKKPQNRAMGSGRDLFAAKKDGSVFPVEISLSHYKKSGETFVIAFIVDISLRKEAEENLVRKQRELENVTNQIRKMNTELERKVNERTYILKEALQTLEQSQKELSEALDKERQLNEIKSRFVSMASHEFRTPLSAVLSSASLISKYTKVEDQENRDRHIKRIKESVNHLNDILEDFLSLGRMDEGRIVAESIEFNLKTLIEETIADFKMLLKHDQHIQYTYQCNEIVNADKRLLKNVIINLVSNASKFSDEGAAIEIKAESESENILLSVTDHGIGISEDDQEHLFSSFFRGSNASNIQGTGLGLHIVKRYTDLMKGTVHLHSQQGKGTTVKVSFPSIQKTEQ